MRDEEFICGDCNSTVVIKSGKKGSRFVELLLWTTLVIPGIFYSLWRCSKVKKQCYYCGSDFLLPKTLEAQEFLKEKTSKNII